MKKQTNTEEKVIQFLISKYSIYNNATNSISISKADIESIGITESEASRTLLLMQTSNILIVKEKSVHNDFRRFWTVELTNSCIHYFDDKKERKIEKRNNWIQFWIPVTISIFALIVSIINA